MKKTLIIILSIVIIASGIILFLCGFIIGGGFHPPISPQKMEKIFEEDYDILIDVVDYLTGIEHEKIFIHHTMENSKMSASGKNIEINNDHIVNSINTLKDRGYEVITKENNTVSFQRWSNLNAGRGIAFSINGTKPEIQFLTELEALNENDWYYYEEDFNEWQSDNTGISHKILGCWKIQYAINRTTGEVYSLDNLYATEEKEGYLQFNSDCTFVKYTGTSIDISSENKGIYVLSYDNKIILKFNNGMKSTVKYSPETQEMIYYTRDKNETPVSVCYKKQ